MARPDTSFNTTYVYDTVADSWTTGPNTNVAHSFTGGTAVGNKLLVVVCGFDGVTGDTNTVEESDLRQLEDPRRHQRRQRHQHRPPTPADAVRRSLRKSTSRRSLDRQLSRRARRVCIDWNHYWRAFNMNTFTGGLDLQHHFGRRSALS